MFDHLRDWGSMGARDFFIAVRDAAKDAEWCRTQIERLRERMHSIGGGGYEPRVQTSSDPDQIGRRVAAYLDRKRALRGRMAEDWALIDRACVVLFGPDQMGGGGLCKAEAGDRNTQKWADVLWWRYCADADWDEIADSVHYSVRTCQEMHGEALRWMERTGFMADAMVLDE